MSAKEKTKEETKEETKGEEKKEKTKGFVSPKEVFCKFFQLAFMDSDSEYKNIKELNNYCLINHGLSIPDLSVEEMRETLDTFDIDQNAMLTDENVNKVAKKTKLTVKEVLRKVLEAK